VTRRSLGLIAAVVGTVSFGASSVARAEAPERAPSVDSDEVRDADPRGEGPYAADPFADRHGWSGGVGLGAGWLPGDGGSWWNLAAQVHVSRAFGRYDFRLSPTLLHVRDGDFPSMIVGYLAVEGVLRLTGAYAMSLGPVVGYASSESRLCTDACFAPIGSGPTLGGTFSPAVLTLGTHENVEVGLQLVFLVFTDSGSVYPGYSLGVHWLFI
jgi:hypothetical protein